MSVSFMAYDSARNWPFKAKEIDSNLGWDEVTGNPIPNPDYIPSCDINLANANADLVLAAILYQREGGVFSANAAEFHGRVKSWLAIHGDELATDDEAMPYIRRAMRRLDAFAALAIERGAIEIYAA